MTMTMTFEHTTLAQRVLFGAGRATENLAAEVQRLGATRVMTIASEFERRLAEQIGQDIDVALWFDEVVQHVPVENAEAARAAAGTHCIDLILCVGGGSTTGLAKAVALTTGIPIVAVPTTYAGSEATNVWGLTGGPDQDHRRQRPRAAGHGDLRRHPDRLTARGPVSVLRAQQPGPLR